MKMWHEARKQERKIRGMLVDYRKRAERRQDFYEKIKADPTQFMQIHGRKCKVHLDPSVAAAGDGSAIIVPWQGQQDNLIDRFDVRAHLDYIPLVPKVKELEDINAEERQCNYERYRILAQNDFLGITEEKFLHQLFLEEQFGANAQIEAERIANKKKTGIAASGGAAIGYTYEDSDTSTPFSHILTMPTTSSAPVADTDGADSDSDVDMDVSIDISKLDTTQAHELNACGRNYGMKSNDFYSFLTKDADEADALKMAREEEQEKIMLSGRKSRRERRAQRERRFAGRPLSPPSYAAKEEQPVSTNVNDNDSESQSPSPENSGKITYITSFGGEDELQPHSKISINFSKSQKTLGATNATGTQNVVQTMTYAEKVKENLEKLKQMNELSKKSLSESPKKPRQYLHIRSSSKSRSKSRSRSRNHSRSRYRRRRSRSRSRSMNRGYRRRDRRRSRSRSRSRSHSRKYRYSRSRSKSNRCRKSSRSRSSRSRSSRSYFHSRRHTRSSSSSSQSLDQRLVKSRSLKTKSRSKSKTPSIHKNRRSKSESLPGANVFATTIPTQPVIEPSVVQEPPEAPIKRYYGRKRDGDTSSEEDLLGEIVEEQNDTSNSEKSNPPPNSGLTNTNNIGKPTTSTTATTFSATETKIMNQGMQGKSSNLREKLKRKMQILLNKQYKADKKAEIERTERQIQQQQEREDEMRELALKLRRRQRELRHKYGTPTSSPSKSSRNSEDGKGDEHPERDKNDEEHPPKSYSKSSSRTRVIKDRSRRSRSRRSRRSRSRRRRSPSNKYKTRRSGSKNRGRRSASRQRDRSRESDYARERERDRDRDRGKNYRINDKRRSTDRDRSYSIRNERDRNSRERSRFRNSDRYRDKSRDRDCVRSDRTKDKDRNRNDHSPKIARKLVDY